MTAADSQVSGFTPKAEPGSPEYKERVAEPIMRAIDGMPLQWRELVHEFGYIDVYHAWRRGLNPNRVSEIAAENEGVFVLEGLRR